MFEVKHKQASTNTKYHCLYDYYMLGQSTTQLGKLYGKSQTTITNWITKYETEGEVCRRKNREMVYKKFSKEKRDWLVELFKERPILYRNEAKLLFMEKFGQSISVSCIHTILTEANMTWQRLERRAIQMQTMDVLRYCEELSMISWILEMLVFLDEVSFDNLDMLRKNGYGVKGQRLLYRSEFCRKARVSLLCFLGVNGLLNTFMTENTFTRMKFVECCREFATGHRSKVKQYPGVNSIWIMDGARIHTSEPLVNYLRALGIYVIFLPAYAPMFNPIEILFGIAKQKFKKSYEENPSIALSIRIAEVFNSFTYKSMRKIFEKCGYQNGKFDPSKGLGQNINLGFE